MFFFSIQSFDFDTARSFLGGSSRHLTRVMSSGRGNRQVMCYLIGAMLLAFFFIYFVVTSFRDK
jgi:blocked-early-in-transport protein 1